MNETKRKRLIGTGMTPYAMLGSLLAASATRESQLTPEEKAERKKRRQLMQEERIRKAKILKNICPNCDGKLIRGKKDKKNDYKRTWSCDNCGNSHLM